MSLAKRHRPSPWLGDGQVPRLRQDGSPKLYTENLSGDLCADRRVIRVVIVEEDHDWYPLLSTNPKRKSHRKLWEELADRATDQKATSTM